MIKTVTFGYRWEGLMLHQWAFTHTDLKAVVLPWNRLSKHVGGMIEDWTLAYRVRLLIQGSDSKSLVKAIESAEPDLILCHCYSLKIPDEILSIPKYGCINIHPGKLPEYIGPRPIEAALEAKEEYLHTTIHYMDSGFDTGKVIDTAPTDKDSNLQRLRLRMTALGLWLLENSEIDWEGE